MKVDKLDLNKLVNVLTSLNNLKTKVDELDVRKLKTIPMNFKKLNNVVTKEVVKKTVYNKLNTKINYLENKISDASTLFQSNQYNVRKQNLEKKIGDVKNKINDV